MTETSKRLMMCVEIGKAVLSTLEREALVSTLIQRLSDLIPARNWTLFLLDEPRQELRFDVVVGLDPSAVRDVRVRVGEGIAGTVAATGDPILVADTLSDPRFAGRFDSRTGFTTRSLITLPVRLGDRTLGVLQIVNPADPTLFHPEALPVLTLLADFMAIALNNAALFERIERLAITDDVSGFGNSRFLREELERYLATEPRLALVFLDMDHFKRLVDAHGHPAGSQALREVAETIAARLGPRDRLARYGGDEYVILLPGLDRDAARVLIESVREAIASTTYLGSLGLAVRVTASFGIATYPEDAGDLTALLHEADVRLYRSKGSGKNTITAG